MPHVWFRSLRCSLLVSGLALAAAVALLACDGGGNAITGGGASSESQVTVRVLSGSGLRGLTLDLFHGADFTVTGVESLGPLATGTCEANPQAGRLRVACVVNSDVSAPFNAWRITFSGPEGSSALASITAVSCVGSNAAGATSDLTCEING